MPLKRKRDKLIVVQSHKTILYAMRVSDPGIEESHKSNFEQNEPDTQKGASCMILLT